jgi:DNA polymerase-1
MNMSHSSVASSPRPLPPAWDKYRRVWHVDYEFSQDSNRRPHVLSMHCLEHRSGEEIACWRDEILALPRSPFEPGDVVVAYSAMAEATIMQTLRWRRPSILCPFTELRAMGNGVAEGKDLYPTLIHAMEMHGIEPPMTSAFKDEMRRKILSGIFSRQEVQAYNRGDTVGTRDLLDLLADRIPLEHALLRGRAIWSLAAVELTGLPVNVPIFRELEHRWQDIRRHFIGRYDEFHLYDNELSFSHARLEDLINRKGWDWPRTVTGRAATNAFTLREQSRRYPELRSFQRLQAHIAELRLSKVSATLGADGFSRIQLKPFWTTTSRCQPQGERDAGTGQANECFLLSLPAWIRGLIRPPPGYTVAEVDFSSQEVVVAAGLSRDPALIADVTEGDVYLRFATRAGLLPENADPGTPATNTIRASCKIALLGSLYGMSAFGLARQLGCSEVHAADLLHMLSRVYPRFAEWIAAVVVQAQFDCCITSPFGWPLHVTEKTKVTTLKNFKMQASGAEALRLSIIAAVESGIQIAAPLHDSVWVLVPTGEYQDQLVSLRSIMSRASEKVCGLPCRTSVETVAAWPNSVADVRPGSAKGAELWSEIMNLINVEAA